MDEVENHNRFERNDYLIILWTIQNRDGYDTIVVNLCNEWYMHRPIMYSAYVMV